MCSFSIIVWLLVGLLVCASLYLWGALLVVRFFPRSYAKQGDKIHIYLNGDYNRTATVCQVASNRFYIYDKVPIPIGYRGRFFSVIKENNVRILCMKDRKHYRLVAPYMFARWLFAIPDDENQLPETENFNDPSNDEGGDDSDDKNEK